MISRIALRDRESSVDPLWRLRNHLPEADVRRDGESEKNSVATALASPLNLLSIIFGSIYFPNYSNGLKDCAKSLGFEWSMPNASGALSVVWRLQWEKDRTPLAKESLTKYNAEDCEALQHLTSL